MPLPSDQRDATYAPWAGSWNAALILIATFTLVRFWFIAFTPFTLIEDEAHYWEWAQRLGLSYYSKGPGIAWLIAGTTALLGDTELGVRLGAPLASAIGALATAGLARDAFGDKRCGFFAAAVFLLVPLFQGVSALMTIDGPYIAAWACAAWAGWRCLKRRGTLSWLALGAALGVGLLFKYTVVLLVPGLTLFAIRHRSHLSASRGVWLWGLACVALALGGLAPIAIWNSHHDWATVRHLLGHVGMQGGDVEQTGTRINPLWMLEFLGVQLALIGPAAVLMSASVRRGLRAGGETPLAIAYCAWIALPVLIFYLGVSLFTRVEGNWAMSAYVTLAAACGWGVISGMSAVEEAIAKWRAIPEHERPRAGAFRKRPERVRQVAWHWTLGWGLAAMLGFMAAAPLAKLPLLESWIPLGRLTSAKQLADSVASRLINLGADPSPFVISQHYGRASQLAFYLPRGTEVYCSSAMQGGRRTQYDEWDRTSLASPETTARLLGRSAVLLGAEQETWKLAFERVEPIGRLEGEHKEDRRAFVGYGFKGFPQVAAEPES